MTDLSKSEAIAYLKISERTLERWVKKYKIAVRYENTEHGRQPFFPVAELERVKEERSPTYQGAITHESPIVPIPQPVNQLWLEMAIRTQLMQQLSIQLVLDINEAEIFSGVGRSLLLAAIKSGKLKAKKHGKWLIRKQDLKEFIDKNELWDS